MLCMLSSLYNLTLTNLEGLFSLESIEVEVKMMSILTVVVKGRI